MSDERHQVGQTLSSDSRGRHDANVRLGVFILPVESDVDVLLCEGQENLVEAVSELVLGAGLLGIEGVPDVIERLTFPLIDSVDLVQRDNKWRLLLSQQL